MKKMLPFTCAGMMLLGAFSVMHFSAEEAFADNNRNLRRRVIRFFNKVHKNNEKAIRLLDRLDPPYKRRVVNYLHIKYPGTDSDFDGLPDVMDGAVCDSDANNDGVLDGEELTQDE